MPTCLPLGSFGFSTELSSPKKMPDRHAPFSSPSLRSGDHGDRDDNDGDDDDTVLTIYLSKCMRGRRDVRFERLRPKKGARADERLPMETDDADADDDDDDDALVECLKDVSIGVVDDRICAIRVRRASLRLRGAGRSVGFELNVLSDDIVIQFGRGNDDNDGDTSSTSYDIDGDRHRGRHRHGDRRRMPTDDWRVDVIIDVNDDDDDQTRSRQSRQSRTPSARCRLEGLHLWNASQNIS